MQFSQNLQAFVAQFVNQLMTQEPNFANQSLYGIFSDVLSLILIENFTFRVLDETHKYNCKPGRAWAGCVTLVEFKKIVKVAKNFGEFLGNAKELLQRLNV